MNAASRLRLQPPVGFVAVVVAAYVSALLSVPERYSACALTPFELTLVGAAGVLYLLLGVYGFAFCRRAGSRA
ncbi:MAG TPA: hypothetical protein VGV38_22255, partial [Pyrinomonadaceae bacterium]|nr:hypothetical protein [Pyrinomonadaceae bacterium]